MNDRRILYGMKQRCYNTKARSYKNYGGRGIKICDRWLESSENFLADMGNRPSKNHSIDRINNNGDYEPTNCRWATYAEQARNRRLHEDRTSEYQGVSFDKKSKNWRAAIYINGKTKDLGRFLSQEKAFEAYNFFKDNPLKIDFSRRGRNWSKKEHIIVNGVKLKICGSCDNSKPLDLFSKEKTRWDGLYPTCKQCASTKDKLSYHRRKRSAD